MSQVLADTLPQARVAILSGPSFAAEIAVDLPAGVTLACADPVLGARLEAIGSARFRVYLSTTWSARR
jgi:glycerol-3-phosphate dehydrogenase (NAD(P)+)